MQRLAALAAGSPDGWVAARAAAAAGHLTAAVGDAEQAAGLFRAALATFTRLDLPVDAAQVRLALAHACARVPAVAVAEATTALETFDRVGATVQADATAALLRSLGAPTRSGPSGASGLTRREQEVLRLIGLGLSNPEIAGRLHISRKTASHQVSNMLAKLGLRNRAEAAAFATTARNDRPQRSR